MLYKNTESEPRMVSTLHGKLPRVENKDTAESRRKSPEHKLPLPTLLRKTSEKCHNRNWKKGSSKPRSRLDYEMFSVYVEKHLCLSLPDARVKAKECKTQYPAEC